MTKKNGIYLKLGSVITFVVLGITGASYIVNADAECREFSSKEVKELRKDLFSEIKEVQYKIEENQKTLYDQKADLKVIKQNLLIFVKKYDKQNR